MTASTPHHGKTENRNESTYFSESESAITRLSKKHSRTWDYIAQAQSRSSATLKQIVETIGDEQLPAGDASLIVFGSLARGEQTEKSDLDWILLIDGKVDSNHHQITQQVHRRLKDIPLEQPGRTGLFGKLVFSHPLVHDIGGQEDSNHNLTLRQLLLLESAAIPVSKSEDVRRLVLRKVLDRYVLEDASFIDPQQYENKIPRFLLNDVIRFWRTMAVDYANKYRAREADGWALRNIKLRMSRKLLFMKGLLMCLSWQCARDTNGDWSRDALVLHLERFVQRTPLDVLADFLERFAPKELALQILDLYDRFLALLNDDDRRKQIEALTPDDSVKSPVFREARQMSDDFDKALRELLFDANSEITKLVQFYGVF